MVCFGRFNLAALCSCYTLYVCYVMLSSLWALKRTLDVDPCSSLRNRDCSYSLLLPACHASSFQTDTCKVVVRPTSYPAAAGSAINLAEVQLFDQAGAKMSSSLLNFTLSSTLVWEGNSFSAGYCNDGSLASSPWVGSIFNTGAGQICHSSTGDPNPMLVVTYPCSLGLSQVVVTNQYDCCSDRINDFSLDVTDAKDEVAYTYAFALSAPSYTIRIPSECSCTVFCPCVF